MDFANDTKVSTVYLRSDNRECDLELYNGGNFIRPSIFYDDSQVAR